MRLTGNVIAAFRRDLFLLLAIFFLLLASLSPWPRQAEVPVDLILVVDMTRSHGPRDQVMASAISKAESWPRGSMAATCQVYAWGAGMSELFRGPWPLSREARDRLVLDALSLPESFSDRGDRASLHQVLRGLESSSKSPVVLVICDGRFPRSGWESSLGAYEGRVEIHEGGPALPELPDVRLRLSGRTTPIPAGEVTALHISVEGAGVAGRRVVVESGDSRFPLQLDQNGRASILFPVQGTGDEVVIRVSDPGGPDADGKNNVLRVPVRVRGQLTVGVLGQARDAVQAALADRPAFRLVAVSSLASPCDVLCLANAPFAGDVALSESLQRDLLRRVIDGQGLLVLGGDAAFLKGGYRSSPLGDALPLLSGRQSNRDLHVLLDHSGSMDRDERYGRALAALDHLVSAMGEADRIQVHLWSGEVLPPIPQEPVARDAFVKDAREELRRRAPIGPTRISGLVPILKDLGRPSDRERLALCLTDLMDPDLLDPEGEVLRQTVRDSLLALGPGFQLLLLDPTEESRRLAKDLGVRFTSVDQITPRVFLEAAESEGFLREVVEASAVGSISIQQGALRFSGRNAVTLRDQASPHWVDQGRNPLLATRRLGTGTIMAAALDAQELAETPKLLDGLLQAVAPPETKEWEFREIAGQWLLAGPGGRQDLLFKSGDLSVPLREIGPGLYEGAPPGVWTGQIHTAAGTLVAGIHGVPLVDPEYEFPRHEESAQRSGGPLGARRQRRPLPWLLLALLSYGLWMVREGTRPILAPPSRVKS